MEGADKERKGYERGRGDVRRRKGDSNRGGNKRLISCYKAFCFESSVSFVSGYKFEYTGNLQGVEIHKFYGWRICQKY